MRLIGKAKTVGELKTILSGYEDTLYLRRKYKIYITKAKDKTEYRLKIK